MEITVIQPKATLCTHTEGMLQHLEHCGRVCYKSEGRITSTSAGPFLRKIIRMGHESVLEHASVTASIVGDRSMSHQLVRHRLCAFCLSGDTYIQSMSQKGWTIKKLYEMSQDVKRKGRLKRMNIRSMNDDGILVANKIKSVVYSGVQKVYKVTTRSGRTIKSTLKHVFITPNGDRKLFDLKVGDFIFANGVAAHDNPAWIEDQYLRQNKTRKEVAALAGVSDGCMGKRISKFGLQKPKTQYPNRQGGGSVKGMFSVEMREQMSDAHKGSKNPRWKGEDVSIGGGYQRCNDMYTDLGTCCICGHEPAQHRHHVDRDPINNTRDNIDFVCTTCHSAIHKIGTLTVFADAIISIESVGKTDTYDIEMEAPYHNFVADGLVVHNSQESQRYCNYGKLGLQVICPPSIGVPTGTYHFKADGVPHPDEECTKSLLTSDMTWRQINWLQARGLEYKEYLEMLDEGVKPEDARSCLPNATKTEIMMTCNIRAWRHIFRERALNPRAQWQIKDLMGSLLKTLTKQVPELFEDLYE